jgi:TetR/AcrR family transcriptional repressor of nem operon
MSREAQKSATRRRILSAAARMLRQRGLRETTVGGVMAQADLTVGGFYAHFRSKSALIAEAFQQASAETRALLLSKLEGSAPQSWLVGVVRGYLTPEHRDAKPPLCALPVTVSEAARAGLGERRAYADACGRFVAALEERTSELAGGREAARERALRLLIACVGGVALARATRGTPLSDEILTAARRLGERLSRP